MRFRDHGHLYVLDDDNPVLAGGVLRWCDWFERAKRVLARETVDTMTIVTSFTGIDRSSSFLDENEAPPPPLLWETTIFGGKCHGLGQRYASEKDARRGHAVWCNVARGAIAPEREAVSPGQLFYAHEAARWTDETATWLFYGEVMYLIDDVSERVLTHYKHLGLLHPRRYTEPADPDVYRWRREPPRVVELYDLAEIIDLCRRASKHPREYDKRHPISRIPQHLSRQHATLLDAYVMPGLISLIEFRVRYGYRCRRVPCRYCKEDHYAGPWGECQKKDSGTRYRVTRADGTRVCDDISAQRAWKEALQLEQTRFAPLLIARDAIAEQKFVRALQIADQLSPDLADPLRREINLATNPPKLDDAEVSAPNDEPPQRLPLVVNRKRH